MFSLAYAPVLGAASLGGHSWLSLCKERHLPVYPVNFQPSSSSPLLLPPYARRVSSSPLSVRFDTGKCAHFSAPVSVIKRRRGTRRRRRIKTKKKAGTHMVSFTGWFLLPFFWNNVMDLKCLSAFLSAGAARRKMSARAAGLWEN